MSDPRDPKTPSLATPDAPLAPEAATERLRNARAKASDLVYFWSWADVALGIAEQYPTPIELIYAFVAEHLNGLDPAVDRELVHRGVKKALGPHKLATVRRRLSSLAQKHLELKPDLDPRYVYHREVLKLLKAARKQVRHRPTQKDAITRERLGRLLAAIDPSTLRGLQERAILAVAFASGGRRRAELVGIHVADVRRWRDEALPGYYFTIELRGTKTHDAGTRVPEVPVRGRAAVYLDAWLSASGLTEGRLFRRVLAGGRLAESMSAESVRLLIKDLQAKAGLTDLDLSPHSLRAGFVTQCGLDNVPAAEGMALSLHRSERIYHRYYRTGSLKENRASRLLVDDTGENRAPTDPSKP